MAGQKRNTIIQNLLTQPTLLAVGFDPSKNEAYIIARNGNGPTIRKKVPLTPQFQAMFLAARSLLA